MSTRVDQLCAALKELVELTILDEGSPQSFRARAYENAIMELRGAPGDIEGMTEAELTRLEGIGKSTAQKIREYFDTGRITKLETLRAKYPPAYRELAKIPGLGPKTLARLRAELGVENVDDLRRVIDQQRVRELKGLGEKSEEKLAKAIARMGLTGKDRRTPIAEALPLARALVAELEALPQVERAQYCGSLRRFSETIGDIDITVASRDPGPVMQHFVALPAVREVIGRGETKSSVLTDTGMQVDLRVVAPDQFGAAIQYFTGSKAHNVELRQRALDRGWTLNEYGLTDIETGAVIASRTEEEIYAALGLPWIPPAMREHTGEIDCAARGELPEVVSVDDMRGDLHVHTDLSGDGHSPLAEVVATAAARGYRYLAITDHGEDLGLNGVSREQLLAQREQLRRLQDEVPDLRLLHGCELNIGPDGGLDYDEDFRLGLDWCIAAVHSHFDLDQAAQTRRIIAAMHDPAVHIIGHLSGRRIGSRPGIELDVHAVLEAAAETGTAIEINSLLPRLDASADVLRKARDLDVVFAISTDAHRAAALDGMQWGVQHSQRGWVARDRVANTWDPERFLAWTSAKRER